MVSDQPRGIRPVACRERVPHRLDDVPVVSEPPSGSPVEVGNLVGKSSAEFEAQEIRQEMVVAKPRAPGVERHDERVGVLQFQQHLLRAQAPCQQVGEFTVNPVDKRGPQQRPLHLARLPFEHLGH